MNRKDIDRGAEMRLTERTRKMIPRPFYGPLSATVRVSRCKLSLPRPTQSPTLSGHALEVQRPGPPQPRPFYGPLSSTTRVSRWQLSLPRPTQPPTLNRDGYRHVQHVRPNMGPHKKGAPQEDIGGQ